MKVMKKTLIISALMFLSLLSGADENKPDSASEDVLLQNKFDTSLDGFNCKGGDASIVDLEGGKVLKITNGGISKWLTLPAGETIQFSVMIKTENVKRNAPKKHWFGATWKAMIKLGDKNHWPASSTVVGSTAWQRKTFKIDVPLGNDVPVLIMLGLTEANGTVYCKDLVIKVLKM